MADQRSGHEQETATANHIRFVVIVWPSALTYEQSSKEAATNQQQRPASDQQRSQHGEIDRRDRQIGCLCLFQHRCCMSIVIITCTMHLHRPSVGRC